jgi:hypothetical protein
MQANARTGLGVLSLLTLLFAGCSSGSGSGSSSGNNQGCMPGSGTASTECGSVLVALTDAEGDFTSYTVDVLSIRLDRASGGSVEMLPQTVRLDFADLTDLSEIVGAATVVPGDYIGGSIRIDYSNAEIYVEAGGMIVPANVYDADGTLLTADTPASIVDLAIRLPNTDRLVVTRGRVALLSVDFDLAASHVVDTSTTPARAVAAPYIVAEARPVDEKEIRVRGALAGVDVAAGTYDIRIRPWHLHDGDFGVFTVATTALTEFEVDEVAYTGTAGLRALDAKPRGTVTVAFGVLNLADHRFTAKIVHAGDSVGGDRNSAVLGNIVSRAGDRLVIKGAVAIRSDRPAHFQRTVIVNVGPNTKVTRMGEPRLQLDEDDLSVGQRVTIFGEIVNPAVDNSDPLGPDVALVIDATEGHARMLVTHLLGRVTRIVPGQINVELRTIDRLTAAMFDFSGTGSTPLLDADPADYEIATATLPLTSVEFDRPVRVLGFVTAFGAAPPDFMGRTIVGPRDLPAALGVSWGPAGTTAPFSVMTSTSLVIDLANPAIGERHHMLLGREVVDLYDLPSSPAIEQSGPPRVYGITEPGHIELYSNFVDFVNALRLRLGASDRALAFAAYGIYTEIGNRLAANKIVVHVQPAGSP